MFSKTKYFFYTCDPKFEETIITNSTTSLTVTCRRFSDPGNPKKACKQSFSQNDFVKVQEHKFVPCNFRNFQRSQFLETHSKKLLEDQTLNQTDTNFKIELLTKEQGILRFLKVNGQSFKVSAEDHKNLVDAGGPVLKDGDLVGSFEKKENKFFISIFGSGRNQAMTSTSGTDGGFQRRGTGQAAGTQPPTPGGGTGQQTLADLFRRKTSVLDDLCLHLDIEYKVIQNWRHLADLLHAPNDVKDNCKCSTKHSPTELLFGMPNVFSVTIKKLLDELREMRRNDVVDKITEKISEADRNKTIDETLLKDDDLCDEVALLLDKDSARLNINWRKLGRKLNVSRDDLDLIGRGNNPANQLFLHAYITLEPEKLKTGYFRKIVDEFRNRNDVKNFLDTLGVTSQDDRSMKDVFPPESDNLLKLCGFLNRNAGKTLKDWENLASAWKIKRDIYKGFDDREKPKPTRILLEDWLVQDRPYFTVEELCSLLTKIERIDVREYLKDEARS